jgi:hypothetical protein
MCRIFVFLKKKNEVFSPKHRPTTFLVPLPIHPSPFLSPVAARVKKREASSTTVLEAALPSTTRR